MQRFKQGTRVTTLNYQQGYCHYLAKSIVDQLRERGTVHARYVLVLATRKNPICIEHILVHAYAAVGRLLIDSQGLHRATAAHQRRAIWLDTERNNQWYDDGLDSLEWKCRSRVVFAPEIPQSMFWRTLDDATQSQINIDANNVISNALRSIKRDHQTLK